MATNLISLFTGSWRQFPTPCYKYGHRPRAAQDRWELVLICRLFVSYRTVSRYRRIGEFCSTLVGAGNSPTSQKRDVGHPMFSAECSDQRERCLGNPAERAVHMLVWPWRISSLNSGLVAARASASFSWYSAARAISVGVGVAASSVRLSSP
jgi:hypothetical protein